MNQQEDGLRSADLHSANSPMRGNSYSWKPMLTSIAQNWMNQQEDGCTTISWSSFSSPMGFPSNATLRFEAAAIRGKPLLTSIAQNWMNHSGKTDWLDLVKLSRCFIIISLKARILESFRDSSDSITHGCTGVYPSGLCKSVCLSVCVSVNQRTLANALHQLEHKLCF